VIFLRSLCFSSGFARRGSTRASGAKGRAQDDGAGSIFITGLLTSSLISSNESGASAVTRKKKGAGHSVCAAERASAGRSRKRVGPDKGQPPGNFQNVVQGAYGRAHCVMQRPGAGVAHPRGGRETTRSRIENRRRHADAHAEVPFDRLGEGGPGGLRREVAGEQKFCRLGTLFVAGQTETVRSSTPAALGLCRFTASPGAPQPAGGQLRRYNGSKT